MGNHQREQRQSRAQRFGARHPRLTFVIVCIILAGVLAVCAYQLSHGTYLGPSWMISAVAGMVVAAGLGGVILARSLRHAPVPRPVLMAWLVLAIASASGLKISFPQEPYGGVQAFFNVLKGAAVGYDMVTYTAIVVLLIYLTVHPRGGAHSQAVHAGGTPATAGAPARLRFAGPKAATWRPGRLIGADGTVTWLSLNGDTVVDLTSACQALPVPPPGVRRRRPRTTTLATASGFAEVDVSPDILAALGQAMRYQAPLAAWVSQHGDTRSSRSGGTALRSASTTPIPGSGYPAPLVTRTRPVARNP
jgi:hypothetical protein